jgi:CO/xanthine dehydrogenase FAD-binding subunit
MRGNVPDYELRPARTLAEALTLVGPEFRPFAGGTDLMVLFEAGKLAHRKFVSILGVPELRGITVVPEAVTLGALTTYSEIREHPVLREEFPMLVQAASETGAIAIQNRGTIGGNIANASPAADSPPALLVYGAELELVSAARGTRRVSYEAFHTGYKKMDLLPDELVRSVRLPRDTRGAIHYYRKVGTRKAQAISKVCFAGLARVGARGEVERVRLAFGSVAPTVLRCARTEDALTGKRVDAALIARARLALGDEISPIDDIRSSCNYRLAVALNLVEDFLRQLCGTG